MSILGRRVSGKTVAALAFVFIIVVGLLPVLTTTRAREIKVIAKDMAFYVDGDPNTANPVIEARAGETIRIVLMNRDRGMAHDFAVPAADAATDSIEWNEDTDVTFDVPNKPGTYEYVCRPHLLMMKGKLIVK